MPIVRLEMRKGWCGPSQKRALLDAVHDALVAAFKIPDHDRTQRILEIDGEDFEIPSGRGPRYTTVEITAFAGRTVETKRALYREIVDRFERVGVPREDVMIVVHDVSKESWGLRGGVPASDLDLGYATNV